jgi:hypothetical protein
MIGAIDMNIEQLIGYMMPLNENEEKKKVK